MATNEINRPGYSLAVVVTDPATPASGDPVRLGKLSGIAMLDEGAGGAGATETVVYFGPGVFDLTVDDNEGTGIAVGDSIWYHDTGTGTGPVNLNNTPGSADAFFGYALETVGANATTLINVMHAPYGSPGTVTQADLAAGSVGVSELTTNLKVGYIPLDLFSVREAISNVLQAAADGSALGSGGILATDTTPILQRINGATDKAARISWVATDQGEIQFAPVTYPPDLDDTAAVVVHLLVYKDANMDATASIAVGYFEGIGDTNAGGSTAAITETTLAEKTVSIAAGDVGAHPNVATITLIPAAHANDAIYCMGAWVEYTRKD